MKSFFQRFHDSSQTGTSKSRTKDAVYKQWIPTSKPDKDRTQLPAGVESTSKRLSTKTAGLRSVDVPSPEALGRVGTDYSTRFSTFPGPSIRRHAPPDIPISRSRPQDPSTPKAPNLKPSEDAKEDTKPPSRRNEAADLPGNEKEAVARVESERPSRSGQTFVPLTSQQPHQIWQPPEMHTGSTDKVKKKERRRQVDEPNGIDTRISHEHGYPDRRDGRRREYVPDREQQPDSRQRIEIKDRERAAEERQREEGSGNVMKEIQRWEKEEKDMRQIREREVRERERLKERLKEQRDNGRQRDRAKEQRKEKEQVEERDVPKERGKEQNKDRERERERETERRKEKEREKERERERREKEQRQKLLLEEEAREAREKLLQLEKEARERQARELRERERRERKFREQQSEREWKERELLEREKREKELLEKERREKERRERELLERERREKEERLRREREERERREKERLEKERREKELLEKERSERERRDREQRERERQQQEKWEREQDERERKELTRLEEWRRKEHDFRQREPDYKEANPIRIGRERQEQRQREREQWEQQRERDREERERRRRTEKHRETPEVVLTDNGTNDKASVRSKRRIRREDANDSEGEQGKTQEQGSKRRLVQTDTPPKPEDRKFPAVEVALPPESLAKSRNSRQHIYNNGTGGSGARGEEARQVFQEDGYISEKVAVQDTKVSSSVRVASGPDPLRMSIPSLQQVRPPPATETQTSSNPSVHASHGASAPSMERLPSTALVTPSTRVTMNNARLFPPESYTQAHRPSDGALPIPSIMSTSHPSFPQLSSAILSKSEAPSAQPEPFPAELRPREIRPTGFASTALTSLKAAEQPQDIRVLPPPAPIQTSHSNAPSAARVLANSYQDTLFSRNAHSSDQSEAPLTHPEKQPTATARSFSSTALIEQTFEADSFPPQSSTDKNTSSGKTQVEVQPLEFIKSTTSFHIAPVVPQVSNQRGPVAPSPLSFTAIATNVKEPPIFLDPPGQEHSTKYPIKNAAASENHQKKDRVTPASQPYPPPPAVSATTNLRPVLADKRENNPPGQDEFRLNPALTLKTVKPPEPPRPSPNHVLKKVQEETPPLGDSTALQFNKRDSKPRVSPYTDKVLLQESTPPTSRQYLSDKSNLQENLDQPIPLPTALPVQEAREIAAKHKHRDTESAQLQSLPFIEKQNRQLPRHQRHHSDTGVSQRGANSSSRSQQMDDSHPVNPHLAESGGSKSRLGRGDRDTEMDGPTVDAAVANIAFRTPVFDTTTSVERRSNVTNPQPEATVTAQDTGTSDSQQGRRQGGNGVSLLVSHYERVDEVARAGGSIVRPGTTVPPTRPTTHEITSQTRVIVPPIGYSQSASFPHIDRPSTTTGIQPSLSSAPQFQPKNIPSIPSKSERMSKFELINFPDKAAQSTISQLTPTTTYDEHNFPNVQSNYPIGKPLLPIPETHPASSSVAIERPLTSHRTPDDPPKLSHKVSYSDGTIVPELQSQTGLRSTPNTNHAVFAVPPSGISNMMDKSHQQSIYREDQTLLRQHTSGRGNSGDIQSQTVHTASAYSPGEPVVRRDNIGNSTRESVAQYPLGEPRQRKESSPRVRPKDDQARSSNAREGDAENHKTSMHKYAQSHGDNRGSAPSIDVRHISQKTEPTRTVSTYAAGPQIHRYATEPGVQPSHPLTHSHYPSTDNRSRSKHAAADSHSPNVPQRTPPTNLASVSPQRTGNSPHSRTDEEAFRTQRNPALVKDARLAELLSPSAPNDVPHQSYLHDARRTLASKLEQQPNSSPNSNYGNSGSESGSRHRSASSRGEHSPRYTLGDASPSGSSHSPSHNQQVDLSTKDQGYVRSSPSVSHHTPSPRTRTVAPENQVSQSAGDQFQGESSRYPPSTHLPRQVPTVRERRQDYISDIEDTLPRKRKATPHATSATDSKIDDTDRLSHMVPNSISQQPWDSHNGRTISQREGSRKEAYDVPQPIAHSRSRSNSQNTPETSSHSRHAYATSYNSALMQVQPHVPTSNHVPPPSAPTIPPFGQLSDQMQYTRSYSSNTQPPTARDDASILSLSNQVLPIKFTPSKTNSITPLPPETRSANTSSATQPPTPKSYEIWLPSSSQTDQAPARSTPAPLRRREPERERKHSRRTSAMSRVRPTSHGRESQFLEFQPTLSNPQFNNPYHYLKTRKMRTMSSASIEAQDGAASTVIGSPTASILSQGPFNIPPEQDPIVAAREWTEAGAIRPGQRIRRPGLVWELPEDPPPVYQQEYRRPEPRSSRSRRPRSSASRSRETSDTDQPSS